MILFSDEYVTYVVGPHWNCLSEAIPVRSFNISICTKKRMKISEFALKFLSVWYLAVDVLISG